MASETLAEAVRSGDRLRSLHALRDRLAEQIDSTRGGREVAALSLRLMDVLAQVAELEKAPARPKGTPRDEVARRRAERKAADGSSGRGRPT